VPSFVFITVVRLPVIVSPFENVIVTCFALNFPNESIAIPILFPFT
jgi:hypothetical protein